MKNKTLLTELRKLNPEQEVLLKVNFKNGIVENGNGNGTWGEYDYLFDYTTEWDSGYMISSYNYTVKDLIELLETYVLSEIDNKTLSLDVGELRKGYPEYNITWLDDVEEDDEDEIPADEELVMDGDIDDVDYVYNYPDSIDIEIGSLSYTLAGDEED